MVTDDFTTLRSPELDLGVAYRPGHFPPEEPDTFGRDVFVSAYHTESDLLALVREAFAKLSSAYPVATLSPPQETVVFDERARRIAELEEMLRRFLELPEDWDSYGGLAISPDAIEEARNILTYAIKLDLPEPWVAPGGDAGIGIQWDTERAELYIDVVPNEETTYALTPKANDTDETDGVLTMENLPRILYQIAESAT